MSTLYEKGWLLSGNAHRTGLTLALLCLVAGCQSPANRESNATAGPHGLLASNGLNVSISFFATPYGPSPVPRSEAMRKYSETFVELYEWRCQRAFFKAKADTNNFGQMRVQFHLNSDGHVSDLILLTNTVGRELGQRFESVLTGNGPFGAWPSEMRRVQYAGYFTMRCGFRFELAGTNAAALALQEAAANLWLPGDSPSDHVPAVWTNFETDPAYFAKGLLLERTNDYRGAIGEFTKAIAWDSRDAWALNHRGFCHYKLKDYDTALSDLSGALEVDPENCSAWNNRAMVRRQLKDYSGMLEDCSQAIRLNSNFSGAYGDRALAEIRLHDFEGAMADVNRSIDLAPSNTLGLVTRARIKYYLQDYQGAMADCDKALVLNEKYALTYVNRGYIELEQSKDSAALKSFGKAIELDEAQVYPRFQIWAIRCKAGKAQDATEELKAHLRSWPEAEARGWHYQLEAFLTGLITEQDLRAAAQNLAKTPQERSDQLCEAAYYGGLKHLFAGEKDQAATLFRECVGTDDKDFMEYTRARAELSQMGDR